jgi:acetolactate synthase I/II/III large subunit
VRTADMIFKVLAEYVDTVFYLPGGGAGPLVDALGLSGLRAVCCLHEQGAGYAALSYAQHRGLGVCLTTSGPGATNAVTPCLAAWVDSVPVVFISGQVMKKWAAIGQRSRGTQEGPITDMVRVITKKACKPAYGQGTITALVEMIKTAQSGRPGPVWLDVPMDVQAEEL